jgi:hypothetical protein
MSQAEEEELEDYEEPDPFAYEHVEIADDEIHHEDEGDYDDTEDVRRDVVLQYVSVKYKHGSNLV